MSAALHFVGGWLALAAATAGVYTALRRLYTWRHHP